MKPMPDLRRKLHIAIRILAAILAIIWMVRIFDFSSDVANVSATTSRSVTYNMIEKISRHLRLGWDEDRIYAVSVPAERIVRKAAHMYEYAVLSLLLCIALDAWRYVSDRPDLLRPGIVLLICLIYAVSDEFHQTFVDGRSGEIRDVCLDIGGAVIMYLLGALAAFIHRRRAAARSAQTGRSGPAEEHT